MTTSIHFTYKCQHTLTLQDELVPSWLVKDYHSEVDFDPNTWQHLTHDYGNIPVDDLCTMCKEEAAQKRRREKAAKARREAKDANAAATPSSDKSTDSGQQRPSQQRHD